jgi:hypothetical protein
MVGASMILCSKVGQVAHAAQWRPRLDANRCLLAASPRRTNLDARQARKAMRRSLRIAALVAAGALLGACARESVIYNNMISPAYRPYEYGYGAGRRDLTTIIVGNPFDVDQPAFETRLVTMLNESPTFLQPTNFTTTPGPSARRQYRAVVVFNRAFVLATQICRSPDSVPVAELGATMRVTAVFCRHNGSLSQVTGELENVAGIDDPRFRRLIRQMVPLLFPPIDPTRDGQENRFLITGGGLHGRLG